MKRTINQLIQLQELTIARQQQEASESDAHLGALRENISEMMDALPEELASQFVKLQKRDGLAIVPVNNGTCAGCGMNLPVSFIQAVRQAEKIYQCPTCARFVFLSDRAIRKKTPKTKRYDPKKTGIERFSSPALMIPNLQANNVEDAIRACAAKLKEADFIDDEEQLVEEALKREAIASTAVDQGLAFPHVRGVDGGGLSMVIAIHPDGFDMGSPKGEKTHILFFMTIPSAASAFYLKLLSGLIQTFRKKDAKEKLLACDNADQMWKTMLRLTKTSIQ